jgi:superfamily I DNA/RNA helicase
MFAANLGRMAKGGNYYDYIASGGEVYTGDQAWRNRNVAAYVDAIRRIKVLGRGESAALIQAILSLKGSKDTFVEALMKLVDEDDVVEEEGGQGGEEAIRQAALAPVRPLMLMAENFSDPENMLAFIAKMKAANEKVEKKSPDTKDDWKEPAVLVGTVHGWKGLETKHVFVSMAGGVFPNFRSDKLAEEQEMTGQTVTAYDEERRLAYVAITRGKDTTTILSPMKTYLGKPAGGSVFINEACIPRQGDPKGEPGVTDYADDNDEPLHPDRVASMQTQSTFVDGLISSMEGMDETPNFITDMML